ncbi:MAG: UDP-N-acetylglucosamine 2-epimerase (non-hydrolyzing) [Elusimicrobiota bacterium]|nr:UDP-N-acetylglucosamine 2-epimerase (non-hydrolyzing) [Elusimicrobiota bacterium]
MSYKKILIVFGTRPEAIKMVPVIKQLEICSSKFDVKVCVTAQHRKMLDQVLEIFKIKSDYDLNIMEEGQTLYYITTACLNRLKNVLEKEKPDLVLVHGDTTTTFAASLAAFYQKIPVGHVEAGLRSFDFFNPYPEELNRVVTDRLCSLLFAPTQRAKMNLLKEGIPKEKIFVTGNTVIDTLYLALKKKHKFTNLTLKKLFHSPLVYRSPLILVTAHRRENFGKPLQNICFALKRIVTEYKNIIIVYPVHPNPNVQGVVKKILCNHPRIHLTAPLNYLDFLNLMKLCYFIVTDSGGLQEESAALGKPVLVLRKVTERPEAVEEGTAKVIGIEQEKIYRAISELLENRKLYCQMATAKNPFGDGKASIRIVNILEKFFTK